MTLFQEALAGFGTMSVLEWIAVLFGVAYVVLAAKESLWAWFFAFWGTLIYTILFWEGSLISSFLLNIYYMVMAIYGFILWGKKSSQDEVHIHRIGYKNAFLLFIGFGLLSLVLGYLFGRYFAANEPYLDAFVFTLSLVATYMMAQKMLENWLFWIVVDSAGIVLYYKSGYYPTVVLFSLYVALGVYGYLQWKRLETTV
jgi:nicotinamide mononucleotide transporter